MSELALRVFPDSILQKRADKIDRVGDSEKKMLADMADTMYLNHGVGLAAVQVGINKQLAVVDIGNGLMKFVNPSIVRREGFQTEEEGCLSVPGVIIKVKRAKKVIVNYLDEHGGRMKMGADGLLSRALQHEIDHLSGVTILDHLNPIKRLLVKRRLAKTDTRGKMLDKNGMA